MKKFIAALTALLIAVPAFAGNYEMMLSLNPPVEDACVAVQLPLPSGSAAAGLRWFQNDSSHSLARVLIREGGEGNPEELGTASLQLSARSGPSLGWAEIDFEQPITSSTHVITAILCFPEGERTSKLGSGGGPGIGLRREPGAPFYVTGDGENWARFDAAYSLGVELVEVPASGDLIELKELVSDTSADDRAGRHFATLAELGVAKPNPFNPRTTIEFSVNRQTMVALHIIDVRGRVVRTLTDRSYDAGDHSVIWNGKDDRAETVAGGVYFVRLQSNGASQTRRVVLLK